MSGHNPQLHGIKHGEARFWYLLQHLHLQLWLDIRQEKQRTTAVLVGDNGMEACIDTQLGVERITRIHIQVVACNPAKRTSLLNLEARQVNRALTPEIEMFLWEITAHDCHQVDLVIKRSCCGKIGCGSAKCFLCSGKWCFNRIQGHRTNN